MIRDDHEHSIETDGSPAGFDGRGARMRALFDEVLGVDEESRTQVLRAASSRNDVDDEMVDEVRSLLAFVDATRIDDPVVEDDRPERFLGCRLGGFTLERLIGIGGTAAVFEATQDRPRRTVAVKVLRQAIGLEAACVRSVPADDPPGTESFALSGTAPSCEEWFASLPAFTGRAGADGSKG